MSEATSGEQAIALVRTVRYDALLLDIHMPGMTGVQTCQEIRKSAPGLGILMLTVRDAEESKIEALDAGADDYVTKPFNVRELAARSRGHTPLGGHENRGRRYDPDWRCGTRSRTPPGSESGRTDSSEPQQSVVKVQSGGAIVLECKTERP